ncbi:4-alpha-glucanotransferase [endosymbiont of Ridgeia piscesae]|jgi:4-alpha-glucanotransferase|uniref:4-alpha-glucanotransferase n=1 Tax=endosymbiont of Ridgeia piscesae TaxID=54398 RepID=A0A0T5YY16_9GAMM|nr:4-alpha-glucanotransferase [endosymbiont of Ridgeia piscesae]KRT55495.1 4-alpha-glucanotransferase [endosymbiont of Ridgeia piscesae]
MDLPIDEIELLGRRVADPILGRRRAGVLLHITSLPGPACVGALGSNAYNFVDFLAAAGVSVWQMLPVNPTHGDGSPYQGISMHAGNPRLISLEPVLQAGWLDELPLEEGVLSDKGRSFALSLSWEGFKERASDEARSELEQFLAEQSGWLDDYALFQALRAEQGGAWWEWLPPLRDRDPLALAQARARLADQISFIRFEQYLFFSQWRRLKRYANERGVKLFGDVPIFVAHDSAEVWTHRSLFDLLPDGQLRVVAGVPPDYFSETGQRWGNPLYRWDMLEADGFAFWIERMRTQMMLFDLVRIDHFRGFEAYWEIPAVEQTAVNGRWVQAPGERLFAALYRAFPDLELVAEDLGIITPEVDALRRHYHLPGMKILQFAFSGDADNPYLPFNHTVDSVVYTGTHDNDTTLGWYRCLDDGLREYIDEYMGRSREAMPWPLIRCAFISCASLAVVPMQDLLGLGSECRMNTPGTTEGNWNWRFSWDQVESDLAERVRRRVVMFGRQVDL